MKILAIETSCDETAAAIMEKSGQKIRVLADAVSSSLKLHAKFGGVVPNLAAREHLKNILPILEACFAKAKIVPQDIDAIAVTQGPGLIPALLVGTTAAKTLAAVWQKPLLGVHHIEGHIYANLLSENNKQSAENKTLEFPLLALVVSGGHTELVYMKDHFQYEILGETQDDASGEAFDKVARLLGLSYPGGPKVAALADTFRMNHPDHQTTKFPRPMIQSPDYHFSFSGLKTAVLYALRKEAEDIKKDEAFIAEMAHEFQEAVVDVLVAKTKKALTEYPAATFVIAGGVSANIRMRERLQSLLQNFSETQFLTPPFKYSLDNAAMIGAAALMRYERLNEEEKVFLIRQASFLEPNANLPLQSLN